MARNAVWWNELLEPLVTEKTKSFSIRPLTGTLIDLCIHSPINSGFLRMKSIYEKRLFFFSVFFLILSGRHASNFPFTPTWGFQKYSLIVKEMREAKQERIHKWNYFRNSSFVLLGENSGSPGIMFCLQQQRNSGVITLSPHFLEHPVYNDTSNAASHLWAPPAGLGECQLLTASYHLTHKLGLVFFVFIWSIS